MAQVEAESTAGREFWARVAYRWVLDPDKPSWSVSELARICKTSRRTLWHYFSSKRLPVRPLLALKIGKAVGMEEGEVLSFYRLSDDAASGNRDTAR